MRGPIFASLQFFESLCISLGVHTPHLQGIAQLFWNL